MKKVMASLLKENGAITRVLSETRFYTEDIEKFLNCECSIIEAKDERYYIFAPSEIGTHKLNEIASKLAGVEIYGDAIYVRKDRC
jgi:hypothetical protein